MDDFPTIYRPRVPFEATRTMGTSRFEATKRVAQKSTEELIHEIHANVENKICSMFLDTMQEDLLKKKLEQRMLAKCEKVLQNRMETDLFQNVEHAMCARLIDSLGDKIQDAVLTRLITMFSESLEEPLKRAIATRVSKKLILDLSVAIEEEVSIDVRQRAFENTKNIRQELLEELKKKVDPELIEKRLVANLGDHIDKERLFEDVRAEVRNEINVAELKKMALNQLKVRFTGEDMVNDVKNSVIEKMEVNKMKEEIVQTVVEKIDVRDVKYAAKHKIEITDLEQPPDLPDIPASSRAPKPLILNRPITQNAFSFVEEITNGFRQKKSNMSHSYQEERKDMIPEKYIQKSQQQTFQIVKRRFPQKKFASLIY